MRIIDLKTKKEIILKVINGAISDTDDFDIDNLLSSNLSIVNGDSNENISKTRIFVVKNGEPAFAYALQSELFKIDKALIIEKSDDLGKI